MALLMPEMEQKKEATREEFCVLSDEELRNSPWLQNIIVRRSDELSKATAEYMHIMPTINEKKAGVICWFPFRYFSVTRPTVTFMERAPLT